MVHAKLWVIAVSVINQALRDLEKRGESPSFTQGISSAAASEDSAASARPSLSTGALALSAALLVMLGFGAALYFLDAPLSEEKQQVASYGQEILDESNDESSASKEDILASSPATGSQEPFESGAYKLQVSVVGESTSEPDARMSERDSSTVKQERPPENNSDVLESDSEHEMVATPINAVSEKTAVQIEDVQVVEPSQVAIASPEPAKVIVKASAESLDIKNSQSARDLLNSGNSAAARAKLERFIVESEIYTASMYELAKLLVKTNDRAALDRLLNNRESFELPEMRLIAARRYVEQANIQSAGRTLESELPAIERHPHYYALLASIYQKQQRYVLQADTYRQLIDIHGDRAKWWLGIAIAWDHLKQYWPARQAYKKTQQLTLSDPKLMTFVDQRLKQLRGH